MKLSLFAVAWLIATDPALAQDAFALRERSLAATCAQCHGTDGHAPPGSAMTSLAGMPAPYLVEQMLAFKTGVRPGTVMPQLAKGYSDAQIGQLAGYFARVTATTATVAKP
jgi:cytochrome c553